MQVPLEQARAPRRRSAGRGSRDGSARPPSFAIRLRLFATSKPIAPGPARRRSRPRSGRSPRGSRRGALDLLEQARRGRRAPRREERLDVVVPRRARRGSRRRPAARGGSSTLTAVRRGVAALAARQAAARPSRARRRQDQREPGDRGDRDRLVEQQRAVEQRGRRHQVRDEARARRAVQPEHPEEDSCADAVPATASASDRGDRLPAGHGVGGDCTTRERKQHERAPSIVAVASTGAGGAAPVWRCSSSPAIA